MDANDSGSERRSGFVERGSVPPVRRDDGGLGEGTGRVCDDYAKWIGGPGFEWDAYCTFTFRSLGHPGFNELGILIVDQLWHSSGRPSFIWLCSEHGRRYGRFHLHALLSCSGGSYTGLDTFWQRRFGFSRIRRYVPRGGAVAYVAKYIAKDIRNEGDYGIFSPDWECDRPVDQNAGESDGPKTGYQRYLEWQWKSKKENPWEKA